MLTKLRQNFLIFKTSGFLKKNRSIRKSSSYKDAQEIGILYSVIDREKHDLVTEFIKNLEQGGKKVVVLTFLDLDKTNYDFKYDFFSPRELSFWGSLNSSSVETFVNQSFDYLFHLDIEPNAFVESILAQSKAKCRIGAFHPEKSGFYELMIKLDEYDGLPKLIDETHTFIRNL